MMPLGSLTKVATKADNAGELFGIATNSASCIMAFAL
jgi:hypothetical protein